MKITKTYCDLCGVEIASNSEQSSYEYWLPSLNEKDNGKTKNWPARKTLCANCAEMIKETCISLKADSEQEQAYGDGKV